MAARGGVEIEWAVAHTPIPGETVTGDASVVLETDGGVLAAAVDGLGHGPHAAEAAQAATAALKQRPGRALDELMRDCHAALAGSRGAAVTLAAIGREHMSWLAVGNVAGVLVTRGALGPTRHVPMLGGIVGAKIPSIRRIDELPVSAGDVVVLATDGVASGFARAIDPFAPAREVADGLLAEFGRGTDDALVLALRFVGVRTG